MKVTITLEDTPHGIKMQAAAAHNGTNDATEASLAYLTAVNIEQRIRAMNKTGVLSLDTEDHAPH